MMKTSEVIRRADRTVAIALALVLVSATGAASVGGHPSTDHPSTVQLRGSVAGVDRIVAEVQPQALVAVDAIVARPSPAEIAMVRFAAEQRCLAEAMYYEARGEGVPGQKAVAEVVFHRMHHRGYPASICGVVYQGVGNGRACQFSFVCNGEMRHAKSAIDWARARLLASKIMSGYMLLGDETDGATSFHAVDVEPRWSGSLRRTVQIGNHIFYRPLPRTRAS
jgi:spore germination cell wall hydrolase CwlJ-like protein